ncbi:MAG TPA: DNA polymerase III subunit gamma and tau, partial [Streptomyces sp.]|nr:DNA polymerase III subunit gamma and tau [Streptomyces sp.]
DAREKGLIDAPADVVERMQAQASVFGAAELSRAADLVNTGLTEMRGATSPRLQLELICARVLLPAAFDDERSLQARLDRLERNGGAFMAAAPGPAMGYVPGPEAHTAVRADAPPAAAAMPAPMAPAPVAAAPAPVMPAAAAPAMPAPTAPPAAPAPAAEPARRPGGWPTASAPGQGPTAPPPAAPAQSGPAATAPAGVPAPAAAPTAGGQGILNVQSMWPGVLEAVTNKRRFTWILLSQNAQVTGFDGTTLQIGFINAGARDNFASSGSEDVLKEALAESFNVKWKVEALVDPTGGGAQPSPGGGGGGFAGRPPAPAPQPAQAPYPAQSAPQGGPPAQQSQGRQQAQQAAQSQGQSYGQQQGQQQAQRSEPSGGSSGGSSGGPSYGSEHGSQHGQDRGSDAPPPPRVAIEDDVPQEDDADLVDSALSGHDLIVRELGATVVEEFNNE